MAADKYRPADGFRQDSESSHAPESIAPTGQRNGDGDVNGAGTREGTETLEALLAAIVDSSDDAICSKLLDGTVTSWNRGAERIFGYSAEEMIGGPISRLACVGREDDMRRVLERLQAGERIEHYETRRRRKDGREITISLTVSPIRDGSGKIVGASKVARDISGQKQAEEALRQADKLAVAGRLAASIAHEINNPLEAMANLLYLMDHEEMSAQARSYLMVVQQELARVGNIAVKTLGFARQSEPGQPVKVGEVLDEALALFRGRFRHSRIDLRLRILPVPTIAGNAGELRQVLANLIGNAVDAMSAEGRLYVRLRPATGWPDGRKGYPRDGGRHRPGHECGDAHAAV